jgi:hypothetical protein
VFQCVGEGGGERVYVCRRSSSLSALTPLRVFAVSEVRGDGAFLSLPRFLNVVVCSLILCNEALVKAAKAH